jgi:hypothetical protein
VEKGKLTHTKCACFHKLLVYEGKETRFRNLPPTDEMGLTEVCVMFRGFLV